MDLVFQGIVSDVQWGRPRKSTEIAPIADQDEARSRLWATTHEVAFASDRTRLPVYVSGELYVGYMVDTPDGPKFEPASTEPVWHLLYRSGAGRFYWIRGSRVVTTPA